MRLLAKIAVTHNAYKDAIMLLERAMVSTPNYARLYLDLLSYLPTDLHMAFPVSYHVSYPSAM